MTIWDEIDRQRDANAALVSWLKDRHWRLLQSNDGLHHGQRLGRDGEHVTTIDEATLRAEVTRLEAERAARAKAKKGARP
jgi:hypothetical protein